VGTELGAKGYGRSWPSGASPKISEKETRKAAAEFEKEQRRREAERRREEAARQKHRERREKATAKAQAALDKAEREHAAITRKCCFYPGRNRDAREAITGRK
jgi:hypothetical protein